MLTTFQKRTLNSKLKKVNNKINKELEKINYNNRSMIAQNEGFSNVLYENPSKPMFSAMNNKSYTNNNIYDDKPIFDAKPSYTLNEEKQLFDQKFNEHINNKSLVQEKREQQPAMNLSSSYHQNAEKKNYEKPNISPPNWKD